jgi:hypothetical protein
LRISLLQRLVFRHLLWYFVCHHSAHVLKPICLGNLKFHWSYFSHFFFVLFSLLNNVIYIVVRL